MAATASKGVILGKVSFLVSRLLESGKKGPYSGDSVDSFPNDITSLIKPDLSPPNVCSVVFVEVLECIFMQVPARIFG